MTNQKSKKMYLELLRILSIIFVLLNHSDAFELYQANSDLIIKIIYILFSCIIKAAVPIFFMISGALLLGKNETYKTIIEKRVKRIIVVLLIFEFGLYVKYPLAEMIKNSHFDIKLWLDFIPQFISGSVSRTSTYWFLYAYIAMLLMLPLLKYMAQKISRNEIKTILIISIIYTFLLPSLNFFLELIGYETLFSLSNSFSIPLLVDVSIICPIFGYYFDNNEVDIKKYITWISLILMINVLVVYEDGIINGFTQRYISLSSIYLSIFIYIFARNKCHIENNKIIESIGSSVFSIYLLEPYIRWLVYDSFYNNLFSFISSLFLRSLIWCITCFIIGYIISIVLKRIPIINKYI